MTRPKSDASGWRVAGAITVQAVVPEVVFQHGTGSPRQWKALLQEFIASGRRDASLAGRFAPLVDPKRIGSIWGAARVFGWPEAEVALQLEADGFRCWTGVQLFPLLGRPVHAADKKRKTDAVERLLTQDGFPLPKLYRARVTPTPKNPDLVCYHPGRREWRFCEVKRTEKIQPGQLVGLALLRMLTGASVAIARVVPERNAWRPCEHPVRFEFV